MAAEQLPNLDSPILQRVSSLRRLNSASIQSAEIAKSPVRFYHVRADVLRMQAVKQEVGRDPRGLRRVRDLEAEIRHQVDTWIEEFVAARNTVYGYVVDRDKCVFFHPIKDQGKSEDELLELRDDVLGQYQKALDYVSDPHLVMRTQTEVAAMRGLHRRWSELEKPSLFVWHSAPPRQRGDSAEHEQERAKQGFGEDMHSFLYYAVPLGDGKTRVYATTLVHQLSEAHAADFLREFVVRGGEDERRVRQLVEVPDDLSLLGLPVELEWELSGMKGIDDLQMVVKEVEEKLEGNELRNRQFPEYYQRQLAHKLARVGSREEMSEINSEAMVEVDAYIARLKMVNAWSEVDAKTEEQLRQYLYEVWFKRKSKYEEIKIPQQVAEMEKVLQRKLTKYEEGMVAEKIQSVVLNRASGVQCAEMKSRTTGEKVKKIVDGKEVWVDGEDDEDNKICELKCRCGQVYVLKAGEKKTSCDLCGWDGRAETRGVWPENMQQQPVDGGTEKKEKPKSARLKVDSRVDRKNSIVVSKRPVVVDVKTGELIFDIGFTVLRRAPSKQQRLMMKTVNSFRHTVV